MLLYVDYTGKEVPGEIHVGELQAAGDAAAIGTLRNMLTIPTPARTTTTAAESRHLKIQIEHRRRRRRRAAHGRRPTGSKTVATPLSWTRDPFDRLIAAHAIVADAPLITADKTIRANLPLATWD